MTKMGIKEFRERLSDVVRGEKIVDVTNHGRIVGTFTPRPPFNVEAAREAARSVAAWQADLRAKGIEPEDWLAEMGLDPWGVPLGSDDDR